MPTFYDRFVECVEHWPKNIALEIQRRDRVESCTYAELRHMAESIGSWLARNGFHSGARVVILADNHPRWVAVFLGVVASGCTAVPLDTALHADQITILLKDSGSSLLFCDVKHLATAREAIGELPLKIALINPAEHNIIITEPQFNFSHVQEAMCELLFEEYEFQGVCRTTSKCFTYSVI